MALGHVVFAGVERLAVQNAHAPVEFRRREFLGNQQVAVLEHFIENLLQFFFISRLLHAHRKARIGRLDHHGESYFLRERVAVFGVGDNGLRRMNLGGLHEFLQVHLIGTAQNAVRVVNHRNALRLRTARETVSIMVHVRGFADEYGVEFTYARVILLGYHLHTESRFFGSLDKVLNRLRIARRLYFVGVRKNTQVVQVIFFFTGGVASLFKIFLRKFINEFHVRFGNFIDANRANALDKPFLLEYEFCTQQRCLEQTVKFLRKLQVLWAHVLTEVNRKYEFGTGEFVQTLLDQVVDFIGNVLDDRRGLEVAHVLDAWNYLVSASFGQQRHVVAFALVVVIAAKVEYAQVAFVSVLARNQVVLCRNDIDARNV